MTEDEARIELYWKARDLLDQYIEGGFASHDDVIAELDNDLTG